LRLSNRAIYGLRALFDLAYHGDGEPVQVKDVADREGIPIRFLEQILQDLKRGDLVRSKRGPKGGYRLSKAPSEISLRDILDVLDELPQLPDICGDDAETHVADAIAEELVGAMCEAWNRITLEDLKARGEEMGLTRDGFEGFVYVI
jgi:Rrf2 family protein